MGVSTDLPYANNYVVDFLSDCLPDHKKQTLSIS